MKWLAKVEIGDDTLVLGDDNTWTVYEESDLGNLLAVEANLVASYPAYEYGESDGRPGWLAANLVKEKMGGEIELNPETDKPYYGVGKPNEEVPPPKNKRLLSSPIYKSLIRKDAEERQAKLDDTVAQLIADNIDPNDEDAEEKVRTLSEMIVAMQS